MRLRAQGRDIITFSFIFLALGSAANISLATLNYLRFYPAVNQIQLQISSAILVRYVPNGTIVRAHVLLDNPTDYAGFKATTIVVQTYFEADNVSLFQAVPILGTQTLDRVLAPHSELALNISVRPDPDQAISLSSFNSTHYGRIVVHAFLRADVSTFLDPVTGEIMLTKEEALPLL